ncbi:MAG: SDR family oxidoreductase [Gemmatimonadaceae bacterium]
MFAGDEVVVIGGSSGIGLGVARAVLREGGRVTIVGRSLERLEQALDAIGLGAGVRTLSADVSREQDVERLFAQVGPVDHVVVTAIDAVYQPVRALCVEDARRVIDSKLIAALLIAARGASSIRPSGSLTLTSGIAAYRPSPGGAVVAAVNGALEALARALALELAPVRVNAVSPGWVDTPIWEVVAGERKGAVLEGMAARLPVGRIGSVDDVADAILFLMHNRYTTGTVLQVDGGHRLI